MTNKKAVYVIQADDTEIPKSISDRKPDLNDLQEHVGGYIEVLPGRMNGRSVSLVINEEGKLYGMPPNKLATKMWHDYYVWKYKTDPADLGDYLAGPTVVLEGFRL